MGKSTLVGPAPSAFTDALAQLRSARVRAQVQLTEVPSPSRIAPYSTALSAEVADQGHELASGRFVLLHDPARPSSWDGSWRAVTFARAELEPELASDPLLGQVGWAWLTDAVSARGLAWIAPAGTVTRVVSEGFAELADQTPRVEIEIRASWTPQGDDLEQHLLAWSDLLCTIGGLEPLPEGVVAMPGRRR